MCEITHLRASFTPSWACWPLKLAAGSGPLVSLEVVQRNNKPHKLMIFCTDAIALPYVVSVSSSMVVIARRYVTCRFGFCLLVAGSSCRHSLDAVVLHRLTVVKPCLVSASLGVEKHPS